MARGAEVVAAAAEVVAQKKLDTGYRALAIMSPYGSEGTY